MMISIAPWRPLWLLAAVAVVWTSASCSSTRTVDPTNRDELAAAFAAGRATLPCGIPCSGRWGSVSIDALGLYAAERWADLAEHVLEIGHGTELSWFYLGTAAERLGYRDAAAVYYRRSIAAASDGTPCQFGTCEHFDLPKASEDRLLALAAETPNKLR